MPEHEPTPAGLDALRREVRSLRGGMRDEVGQLLTGLRLMIEAEAGPGTGSRQEEMKRTVKELTGRVRDLSMDLRPPMLDELGLLPTLLWHVERFEAPLSLAAGGEEAQ